MRTTITLDDDLVERASELTGITERAALVRQAVSTLIRVESSRRLIALGGSDPAAEAAPRHRGMRDRQDC
ncbi:type II toxin-antitoxin system VapB family antitoxin [Actinomyces slackii]|uniref:Antitoxin VapB32 n=1 Tax=Actinomyces slackii TaxID=52774 RepID=A0A448KDA7_9ACTO|nr:type II toxin-antitoxin system VapB family antitoxin [Actinomyces slackii]VEG74913.1 Antitoxin VapB32 [Actinomyces slackii]